MAKQDYSIATYLTLNADEIKLLDAEKSTWKKSLRF